MTEKESKKLYGDGKKKTIKLITKLLSDRLGDDFPRMVIIDPTEAKEI